MANSRLIRPFGRVPAALVICSLLLALPGCTVKKPQVPILDVTLSISVADDTTRIRDLAERTEFLQIDSEGLLGLDFAREIDERVEVENRLRAAPQRASYRTQIGSISIPDQEIPAQWIPLGQLTGREIPQTESAVSVPGFDFETRSEVTLEGMSWLEVEEGDMEVSVRSGLPMPVSLRFVLIDRGNGDFQVDEIDLGRILPDASAVGAITLDGKGVSGALALVVRGGTEDAEVTIGSDPGLEIAAKFRPHRISEATGLIPSQVLTASHGMEFSDADVLATRAVIREGAILLDVRHDIPVDVSAVFTLDDLLGTGGEPRSVAVELRPGEETSVRLDLAGNEFVPRDPRSLRVSYDVTTSATETEVALRSEAEIQVDVQAEEFLFSRLEGTLDRVEVAFNPISHTFEFPAGLDRVDFASSLVRVQATSAIGLSSEVKLFITGLNQWGTSDTLALTERIGPGDPDEPVSYSVVSKSPELTRFLNLLPTDITIVPTVFLGDGSTQSAIQDDHWVRLDSVWIEVPGRLRITGDTRIEPDPEHREVSDDEWRRRIRSNLKSASVITKIENYIPLGLTVSVQVGRTADEVYRNPVLTVPTDGTGFRVAAAPVDDHGRVVAPTRSEKVVELTAEDVLVFLEEGGVYSGVLVQVESTDGEIGLFGSDFLTVQAGMRIIVEVNESLVESNPGAER